MFFVIIYYDIVEYKIFMYGFFIDEIWFSIIWKVVVFFIDVYSGIVFIIFSVIGFVCLVFVRNIDKCNGLLFYFLYFFNIIFEIDIYKREGLGRVVVLLNIYMFLDVWLFKLV